MKTHMQLRQIWSEKTKQINWAEKANHFVKSIKVNWSQLAAHLHVIHI